MNTLKEAPQLFISVDFCSPEMKDFINQREACRIMRNEFNKSEKYCNWRGKDDIENVSPNNLQIKRNLIDRKLILGLKDLSEEAGSHLSPSRQHSLTDSENSHISFQPSPPGSSGWKKKTTYWNIQRGKLGKKFTQTCIEYTLILDLGTLNPNLYIMSSQKYFKLNIALKYSVLEDIVSVIIFKCTFQVSWSNSVFYQ